MLIDLIIDPIRESRKRKREYRLSMSRKQENANP